MRDGPYVYTASVSSWTAPDHRAKGINYIPSPGEYPYVIRRLPRPERCGNEWPNPACLVDMQSRGVRVVHAVTVVHEKVLIAFTIGKQHPQCQGEGNP